MPFAEKLRVCAVVDNTGHCFTTTMEALARRLPFQLDVVPSMEHYRMMQQPVFPYDLVYYRSWWAGRAAPPGVPWIVTVTTGGKHAELRLNGIKDGPHEGLAVIVAQNRAVHDVAMKLDVAPAAFLPNGIDLDRFAPAGTPPKGYTVGLAAKVNSAGRARLKGLSFIELGCKAAGMQALHTSELAHASMPAWYRSLWAYCQPSDREGCSNSLMEAMASGLACLICEGVGYHGAECRDARKHKDGEVLFVTRSPASIEQALRALKADPELRRRAGSNARRFAAAHSWDELAGRFADMFRWAAGHYTRNRQGPPDAVLHGGRWVSTRGLPPRGWQPGRAHIYRTPNKPPSPTWPAAPMPPPWPVRVGGRSVPDAFGRRTVHAPMRYR